MKYSTRIIQNPKSKIQNRTGLPSDVRVIGELLDEGYKPHDIAVLLQIPLSAVRAKLRRLRRYRRAADDADSNRRRSVESASSAVYQKKFHRRECFL